MTSVQATSATTGEPAAARETFDSLDPATDEVVGTHPVHAADEVATAVERAR
jgi:acyl-CoA reductase-like NAD-dependent aldehyde dehydrogenase